MSAAIALECRSHPLHRRLQTERACPHQGCATTLDRPSGCWQEQNLDTPDCSHLTLGAAPDEDFVQQGLLQALQDCSHVPLRNTCWYLVSVDVSRNTWLIRQGDPGISHPWPVLNLSQILLWHLKKTNGSYGRVEALSKPVMDEHCHGPPERSGSEGSDGQSLFAGLPPIYVAGPWGRCYKPSPHITRK